MRIASLFAGIGGFDLGFTRAGCEVVAHVELDANCRRLLAAKWPAAVQFGDIRTVDPAALPAVDVVTFGFPCQDLSVAGKRAGLQGERSGLFYEAMRIIDGIKPAWLIWENVPGLLSTNRGTDFARVLIRLAESNYFGAVGVLDAQWHGVAQRRRRLFGVFARGSAGAERCAEILSFAARLRRHTPPRREAGEGNTRAVAPCIGASGRGFSRAGDPRGQDPVISVPAVACTLSAGRDGYNDGSDQTYIPEVAGTLTSDHGEPRAENAWTGRYISAYGFGGESDASSLPTAGDRHPPITCRHGAPGFVAQVAQVQWASGGGKTENDTAQALRANAETNYQFARIGAAVRRLTPVECERLQGFPDNWTAGFSDAARYRMLGNAVCVNVAEWIARRLAAHVEEGGQAE